MSPRASKWLQARYKMPARSCRMGGGSMAASMSADGYNATIGGRNPCLQRAEGGNPMIADGCSVAVLFLHLAKTWLNMLHST